MSKVDDELTRRLRRAERPVEGDGLFEGLERRRSHRERLRKVQAGMLALRGARRHRRRVRAPPGGLRHRRPRRRRSPSPGVPPGTARSCSPPRANGRIRPSVCDEVRRLRATTDHGLRHERHRSGRVTGRPDDRLRPPARRHEARHRDDPDRGRRRHLADRSGARWFRPCLVAGRLGARPSSSTPRACTSRLRQDRTLDRSFTTSTSRSPTHPGHPMGRASCSARGGSPARPGSRPFDRTEPVSRRWRPPVARTLRRGRRMDRRLLSCGQIHKASPSGRWIGTQEALIGSRSDHSRAT